MRWRVRKLRPDQSPNMINRWTSSPYGFGPDPNPGTRHHPTHAEALARAIRKAYGTPRKAPR